MKKSAVLLCCVILIVSLCACKNDAKDKTNDNLDVASVSSTNSTDDQAIKQPTNESLYEKLVREIDGAYNEELKAPENSSTIGMIELSNKYTEKWKQVADEYYDKIIKYDDITPLSEDYYSAEDLHTFVSNMKTNWEEYNQEQCSNYAKTLQTIYAGGTIIGPIMANYEYEMQKEWALQLVAISQHLGIK